MDESRHGREGGRIMGKASETRRAEDSGEHRVVALDVPGHAAKVFRRGAAHVDKGLSRGQIAALAGMPSHARLVGRILANLPSGTKLPWHRVINSQGKITNPDPTRQRARLEEEGITLVSGRVNLKTYGWQP